MPRYFPDFEGFAEIRRHADIPIIADESCVDSRDIPRLAGCVDGINIKLAKCGSLREALRMIAIARAHQLQVMVPTTGEPPNRPAGAPAAAGSGPAEPRPPWRWRHRSRSQRSAG